MTRIRFRNKLLFYLIGIGPVLLMAACGGGGGLADGGIGGTGVVSAGSVSSLGSIVVNGVDYRVTGASYTREDEGPVELTSETQTEIKVGMVVEVDGELDPQGSTGQALTIRYADILEGPINAINSLGGTVKVLTVLNQQVIVEKGFTAINGLKDDQSYLDLDSFSGMLEVSGFRLKDGRIQATYLEYRSSGRLEIKGVVTRVDSPNAFNIGKLHILHPGTTTVVPDILVEIKGSAYSAPDLTATSVSLESTGLSVANRDAAEIEGFISAVAGTRFQVDGQAITYSTATLFDGGAATDLVDGAKIEAEGPLAAGVLNARKISFKEGIRLESNVAAIDANNGTLSLRGLNSVTLIVDPATTELDGIAALNGLRVDDHIQVRGHLTATPGTVLVTHLTLRSTAEATAPFTVILRGPVEDTPVIFDQLTILGLSIDTSGAGFSFRVEQDNGTLSVTSRGDFYAGLVPGEVVKLKGAMNGVITWNEAEKQNDL